MGKTTIASKIDEESELLERFEDFEEETGYGNRSKALRAAIRRGLDQYEEEQQEPRRRGYTAVEESLLTIASVIAGVVLFLPLLGLFGVVELSTVIAVGAIYLTIAAAIALGVDLRARRAADEGNAIAEVAN